MFVKEIQDIFEKKGYKFFDNNSPFNLNLFAVRTTNGRVNKFDDFFFAVYRNEMLNWQVKQWECTTKAGLPYLQKPLNTKGTGILVPGQYQGAYSLGWHKITYRALVQMKPVRLFRDNNRDNDHDMDPAKIESGLFGVNIHCVGTGPDGIDVNKRSAACIDFDRRWDFYNDLIPIVNESIKRRFPNEFTFTLLDEKDLK
jgi:hypothetical protein